MHSSHASVNVLLENRNTDGQYEFYAQDAEGLRKTLPRVEVYISSREFARLKKLARSIVVLHIQYNSGLKPDK